MATPKKKTSDGKVLILKLLAEARDELKPAEMMPLEELKAKYKDAPKTLSAILSLRASAGSEQSSHAKIVRWFDILIKKAEKAKTPEDAVILVRNEQLTAERVAEQEVDEEDDEYAEEESEQNSDYSNVLEEVLSKYYKQSARPKPEKVK